jgi:aspartyl-tRNA(Asn)/glutamyl-tRNA(Gln) amidotransferase subunit A
MELHELTITQVHEKLINKEVSAAELVRAFLTRINDMDKEIAAFLSVFKDSAMSQAKEIDNQISSPNWSFFLFINV